jgi:hypothetical protein
MVSDRPSNGETLVPDFVDLRNVGSMLHETVPSELAEAIAVAAQDLVADRLLELSQHFDAELTRAANTLAAAIDVVTRRADAAADSIGALVHDLQSLGQRADVAAEHVARIEHEFGAVGDQFARSVRAELEDVTRLILDAVGARFDALDQRGLAPSIGALEADERYREFYGRVLDGQSRHDGDSNLLAPDPTF